MNVKKSQPDSKPGILLDTQYVIEEFNLTWRLANYSQLFDSVHAEFELKKSSTIWKLKLVDKRYIDLSRCDGGEPVNVEIKYCLVSRYKTFKGDTFHKFLGQTSNVKILRLETHNYTMEGKEVEIEFENDILKFYCMMKIVGPAVTKVVRSSDFLKPDLEILSSDLRKLLLNRDHCDVIISTGINKIPVHKAILCARSKVFETMFHTDMLESKNQLIEMDDLDFDSVNDLITFLYTGEVNMVSLHKVMNLYYAADKYEVEDLREKCSAYLEFNLSVDEVCTVLQFAELHRDEKLKNAVRFFIQMHATDVKETDGWKNLVKTHPKLALNFMK